MLTSRRADSHRIRSWAVFAWAGFIGAPLPPPEGVVPVRTLAGHGVLPLISYTLTLSGDRRARALVAEAQALEVIQRSRLRRLREAWSALESAGCAPVLIKGGSFILRFTPDRPGLRPCADFDVLVAPGTLDQASEALSAAGFTSTTNLHRPSRRLDKARSWVTSDGGLHLDIDLHQRLDAWPLFKELCDDVHSSSTEVEGLRCPSVPAMVGILALHVMRSAFVRPLREHLDLLTLLHSLTDDAEARLLDDLHRWRLLGAFIGALHQAGWLAEPVATGRERRTRLLHASSERVGRLTSLAIKGISSPTRSLEPLQWLKHPAIRRTLLPILSGESTARVITSASVYGLVRKGEDGWDALQRWRSHA